MNIRRISGRYLLLFLLMGLFAAILPYTFDDWVWGTDYAVERYLSNWFADYNGRYVGNLVILALTRVPVLRVAVMAAGVTVLVRLMERLIRTKWAFRLILMFFLCMPKAIFSQTIAWTSGYANYVISAIPVLLLLLDARGLTGVAPVPGSGAGKYKKIVPFFLLTFLGGLIMENVTFLNLLFCVFVLAVEIRRERRVRPHHVAALAGSAVSAACMFSNSAYGLVRPSTNIVRVRRIVGGRSLLTYAWDNWCGSIYGHLFADNTILLIAFAVVLTALYQRRRRHFEMVERRAAGIALGCFDLYAFWEMLLHLINLGTPLHRPLPVIDAAFTALAIAAFIVCVLMVTAGEAFAQSAMLIGCISLLSAPLFAANPISPRCFFLIYLLLVVLLGLLLRSLAAGDAGAVSTGTGAVSGGLASGDARAASAGTGAIPEENRVFVRLVRLFILVGCLFYCYIYGANHMADIARLRSVREQLAGGARTAVLTHLPYESYLCGATPYEDFSHTVACYKDFYGIPQEVSLIFEPYGTPVSGMELSTDLMTFTDVTPRQLTVSMPEGLGDRTVLWSSSDPAVAKVDENGLVTPVGFGKCVITAAAENTSLSVSCTADVICWSGELRGLEAESGDDGIFLTWEPVEGAEGYLVFAGGDDGTTGQLAVLMNPEAAFYLDRDAPMSTYRFYLVYPVKTYDGSLVKGVCEQYAYAVRVLPEVENFELECDENQDVILTWDEVPEADGYVLKVKRGNGEVFELAALNEPGYVDTEAPAEEESYYWVFAYQDTESGRVPGRSGEYRKVVPDSLP